MTAQPFYKRLSEDWWAVVIGLMLVLIVRVGLLPQVPWPLFGWFK